VKEKKSQGGKNKKHKVNKVKTGRGGRKKKLNTPYGECVVEEVDPEGDKV
jgi:hypothetical protein